MYFGKKAVKFDIVEVIPSPYENGCNVGEKFVVLDVLDDGTIMTMDKDGSLISLCYPEDYEVVSNVDEFNDNWKKKYLKKI